MNRALVVALLRQRLASPMRVVLVGMLLVPGMGAALLMRSLAPVHETAYWLALVLAAGAIGQDVSSGVLHLTFARPVTRASYVASRWFAAALAAFALALAQLLPVAAALALRGAPPAAPELLAAVLQDAVLAATAAAVMVCFSSLVTGLGDVALLAISAFVLQVTHLLAQFKGWTGLDDAVTALQQVLHPTVDLAWIAGQGPPSWGGLATAATTILLGLATAVVVVRRRELTYAAG